MNHTSQGLQIHIHKVDGSLETFTQSEAGRVNCILDEFQPTRIFAREKIIIADRDSLTSLPAAQVVRIDLVSESETLSILPPEIVNAVELTETEFQALRQNPELGDQWNQARTQEVSVVALLEVAMTGQQPLFLALEVPPALPADLPGAIPYPFYPLAIPTLCFRMRAGGIAALNPLHLIGFKLFPAPEQAPVEAWSAHRTGNLQPQRSAGVFCGPAAGQPLLSFFRSMTGRS